VHNFTSFHAELLRMPPVTAWILKVIMQGACQQTKDNQ